MLDSNCDFMPTVSPEHTLPVESLLESSVSCPNSCFHGFCCGRIFGIEIGANSRDNALFCAENIGIQHDNRRHLHNCLALLHAVWQLCAVDVPQPLQLHASPTTSGPTAAT